MADSDLLGDVGDPLGVQLVGAPVLSSGGSVAIASPSSSPLVAPQNTAVLPPGFHWLDRSKGTVEADNPVERATGWSSGGDEHLIFGNTTDDAIKRMVLNKIYSGESNSYNEMYGGGTFGDYSDHPRQRRIITEGPHKGEYSDAAGAPQFLSSTWDMEKKKLGLKDFSPASQDAAAWDLASTTYKGATGRDLAADAKVGKVQWSALAGQWPSLAGADVGPGTSEWKKGGGGTSASRVASAAPASPFSSLLSSSEAPSDLSAAQLLQGEMKLQILRSLFPQHNITQVEYDPWKVMPQGGATRPINVNEGVTG